ncbi:hypothetical protein UFOVP601_40 [uncultured Caudovirales phage]|uniref:Uncharacterized protein n=1 Tax=uncultured Caudovirales phage TaxID=2100421 RepID=A0A6J5N846_9CAUD|nr:hypothetical protein UFOVP601_40 [uncultured Caudovirales phage]
MGNNTKSWDRYCRHNNIPEKEVILASFIWNHDYDVSEDELN